MEDIQEVGFLKNKNREVIIIIQPKREEITNKLKEIINGEITREEVGTWALEFIRNDSSIEVRDIDAWHYLVLISSVDEMIALDEYLYSIEDIKEWIEKSNKH